MGNSVNFAEASFNVSAVALSIGIAPLASPVGVADQGHRDDKRVCVVPAQRQCHRDDQFPPARQVLEANPTLVSDNVAGYGMQAVSAMRRSACPRHADA